MESFKKTQVIYKKLKILQVDYEQIKEMYTVSLELLRESMVLTASEVHQESQILQGLRKLESDTQMEFEKLRQELIDIQNSM